MNFINRSNSVGVFDSGIGGLTVVKQINSFLPNEGIVYFGDTARVPYGSKSNSTVVEYSLQNARFLISKNVKIIVAACNTASSVALEILRENYDVPIIGMIKPGAKMAAANTKNGRIGIIGTNATIRNNAYSKELHLLDKNLEIIEKECPLFVPLAEEGWIDHKATYAIAEEYLAELRESGIDTLILGCTHYPILASVIQKVIGDSVKLIDSGTAASLIVEEYLEGRNLRNHSAVPGNNEYYVSDLPVKFKGVAQRFLGKKITDVTKIDIENLLDE